MKIKIQKKIIENYEENFDENKDKINEIITLMKEEKSIHVYHKLNYLLFRTIGFSNKESSQFLNGTKVTGNNWYKQWENNGYEGLLKKNRPRSKTKTQ